MKGTGLCQKSGSGREKYRWTCGVKLLGIAVLVILAGSTVRVVAGPQDSDPVLTFSSYLGGQGEESIRDLKVLPDGSFLLVGSTFSADFPTRDSLQPFGGRSDGFVTKISSDGSTILFSTFLGVSEIETIHSVGVDQQGNIYLVGWTSSRDFPLVEAFQTVSGGDSFDFFVTSLTPDGTQIRFSTYLGGQGFERNSNVVVGLNGEIFVIGSTDSEDFPGLSKGA